ncbi:phosphotransferase [Pseudofrankia inefficax]|uniref:Aminoglycoside phosphotransferase n=1 Tax=Pseudofrankia inefficax (strain DSM 45817 / CECT 9037 / DDB 130130 / EuI1c) TaxID=298654 RepID=E3J5D8_PSEI1|nr:phosphotransferase [Pseudofrankia inefficax]ADP81882.1 aminoglycoside phosphotransferase [Pseudofrankia inefficax]
MKSGNLSDTPLDEPEAAPGVWVVDDPAEVTPEWMTSVLRAGGTDLEVTGLSYEPIGTGQLGASYRFVLDAGADDYAPRTVVLKMATGPTEVRDLIGLGYRTEVNFYRLFAPAAQIRVPRCWSADITADARQFTLVLQDAHPALPGSQVEGCTVEQAAAAVRNLAGLHASFWNDDRLTGDGLPWLRRGDERALTNFGRLLVTATAGFVERFAARLAPEDADTLRQTAAAMSGWGRRIEGRHSLIHGDYRLDNLLFAGADDVTAVDWQSLEVGFPGRDLAYFLSTALPPALRRTDQKALVGAYHEALVGYGVADYSLDDCFTDYRLGMPQGPLITVLGCMYSASAPTERSDQMFLSMAANACAAIRDLGTLDLLTS